MLLVEQALLRSRARPRCRSSSRRTASRSSRTALELTVVTGLTLILCDPLVVEFALGHFPLSFGDSELRRGVKHLVDIVLVTGFSRGNIIASSVLLVLVDRLTDDPERNILAEQFDEDRDRGRDFLLLVEVVDVDDLILGVLLGQRLVGRHLTDVIDDLEARQ